MRTEENHHPKEEGDHIEILARKIAQEIIALMPLAPAERENKMMAVIIPILREEMADDGK